MKKFVVLVLIVLWAALSFSCQMEEEKDYIRIHIMANDNQCANQNIKYAVRDSVINYLTPYVIECDSKQETLELIEYNLENIRRICDSTLSKNGFNYKSRVSLVYEYFPLRDYNGITVEAGYYNSLMIELGEAKGANWWCMIYPPLCFTGEHDGTNNIKYKSKIAEIINNINK